MSSPREQVTVGPRLFCGSMKRILSSDPVLYIHNDERGGITGDFVRRVSHLMLTWHVRTCAPYTVEGGALSLHSRDEQRSVEPDGREDEDEIVVEQHGRHLGCR